MANLCLLKLSYGTMIFPLVLTGGAGWTIYSSAPETRETLTVPALGADANFSVHGSQHAKAELANGLNTVIAKPTYSFTSKMPDPLDVALAPVSGKVDIAMVGRSMSRADRAVKDGVEIVRLVLPEASPLGPDGAALGPVEGDRAVAVSISIDPRQSAELIRSAVLREELVTTANASVLAGALDGAVEQATFADDIKVGQAEFAAPVQSGGGASLAGLAAASSVEEASSRDSALGAAPIDFDLSRAAVDQSGLSREVSARPTGLTPVARTIDPSSSRAVKPRSDAQARLATRAVPLKKALGGRIYSVSQDVISFTMPIEINGRASGSLPLQVSDSNMISVKLADLLEVFRTDPGAGGLAALANTAAAQEYVSFDQIRAAGIPIRYDAAHDRIII